jgi:hypothetical protein
LLPSRRAAQWNNSDILSKSNDRQLHLQQAGASPSPALREEHRLRVFENRVLRRIFGPKRDEMTGGWRKLHNEELHHFHSAPNIIRIISQRG